MPSTVTVGTNNAANLTNPYKFYGYRNAALNSVATTTTAIVFDTELYDTSSNFNTTTGVFTAPVAGYYQFTANMVLSTATNRMILMVYKNGAEAYRMQDVGTATIGTGGVSPPLLLAISDTVDIRYYVLNAIAFTTGSAFTSFSGYLVTTT